MNEKIIEYRKNIYLLQLQRTVKVNGFYQWLKVYV